MKSRSLNFLLLLGLINLIAEPTEGQSPLTVFVEGGLIIGTPLGPISTVSEGASGRLGQGVNAGIEVSARLLDRWSFNGGILFAHKSNEFQTPVAGKYNLAGGVLGIRLPFPINAKYTGIADGEFSNQYLDFPVFFGFHTGKRTALSIGYQYSHLLRGRLDGEADVKALLFNFRDQEFDESHLIKGFDHAAIAGVHYRFVNNLELRLRFSYGLNGIFSQTPEGMSNMRNLYLGAMLAYGFEL